MAQQTAVDWLVNKVSPQARIPNSERYSGSESSRERTTKRRLLERYYRHI
jgi:hypothetical protein